MKVRDIFNKLCENKNTKQFTTSLKKKQLKKYNLTKEELYSDFLLIRRRKKNG